MKKTGRKMLSLLLAVAMVLAIVPAGLMTVGYAAEKVAYMDYDSATKTFTEKEIDTYNKVEASTTTLSKGWWVVDGDVTTAGLTCSGQVNLILTDGSSLTVTGNNDEGISSQYPITIYSQINSTGKLTVTATGYGYESVGYYGLQINSKLTVNGGNVSFSGASYDRNGILKGGEGINCSDTITVNGGNLSAVAGYGYREGGCGIYSRYITVNGGNVSATGGNVSATGGNEMQLNSGDGIRASKDITINGGTVKAVGGNIETENYQNNAGDGILAGGKLFINGGNVTAIGGTGQNNNNGSGIDASTYINKALTVKADNNATPTTVIEHESDTNLASSLDGKRYATVTDMLGDGSQANPYQITNYQQLQDFFDILNAGDTDACGKLMNDIICNGMGFKGYGFQNKNPQSMTGYTGTFDGNGKTIYGLKMKSEEEIAMFMNIGTDGIVKNVNFDNVTLAVEDNICNVITYCNSGTIRDISFENVKFTSTTWIDGDSVAYINYGTIENITVGSASVSSPNASIAGITGDNYGTVKNCIVRNTFLSENSDKLIAGICSGNSSIISGCVNQANISNDVSQASGICRVNKGNIKNCLNCGNVSNSQTGAGIASRSPEYSGSTATVTDCINVGKITPKSSSYASYVNAVFWGSNTTVTNCYYDSETSGSTDSSATGKKTAELKGKGVVKALGFSEEEWTERENDYPLPTGVFNMLYTEITADMVDDISTLTYSGAELEPAVIVTDGDKTLVDGKDYEVTYNNNIDAGTATATVHGIGYYYGTIIKEFTINKISLTITSASDTKTYDGKALTKHNAEVSVNDFATGEGVTYNFTGSQTNVGSSDNKFTCTFNEGTKENNYAITYNYGTLTVTAKPLNVSMISGVDNATYTGTEIKRNVVVKDGENTLVEKTDYTVSYSNNTNAGTDATVTITGIGNYCGTVEKKFTISPASQAAPTGITKTDETKESANDGTISGLTSNMEIAFESGEYSPCDTATMTGLAPGTYHVRYAESQNYAVSDSVQIVIEKGAAEEVPEQEEDSLLVKFVKVVKHAFKIMVETVVKIFKIVTNK